MGLQSGYLLTRFFRLVKLNLILRFVNNKGFTATDFNKYYRYWRRERGLNIKNNAITRLQKIIITIFSIDLKLALMSH